MRASVLLISLLLVFFDTSLYASETSSKKDDPWYDLGVERIDGAEPPAFALEDASGVKRSLDDFKGRVVVVNFWATWCPPCIEEMPSLDALHEKFNDQGLSVVAINDYESRKTVMRHLKKNRYSFIVLLDPSGKTSEAFRSLMLPTTFIIDRSGLVIGKAIGGRQWDSPESFELFEELLK